VAPHGRAGLQQKNLFNALMDYHTTVISEAREIVEDRLSYRFASGAEVLQAQTRLSKKDIV